MAQANPQPVVDPMRVDRKRGARRSVAATDLHRLRVRALPDEQSRLRMAQCVGSEAVVMLAALSLLPVSHEHLRDLSVVAKSVVDAEIPKPARIVASVSPDHRRAQSASVLRHVYAMDDGSVAVLLNRVFRKLLSLKLPPSLEPLRHGIPHGHDTPARLGFRQSQFLVVGELLVDAQPALFRVVILPGRTESPLPEPTLKKEHRANGPRREPHLVQARKEPRDFFGTQRLPGLDVRLRELDA